MDILFFPELDMSGGLSLIGEMFGYLGVMGFDVRIGPFHNFISFGMILVGLICMDIGIDLIHHIWEW